MPPWSWRSLASLLALRRTLTTSRRCARLVVADVAGHANALNVAVRQSLNGEMRVGSLLSGLFANQHVKLELAGACQLLVGVALAIADCHKTSRRMPSSALTEPTRLSIAGP